jgi:hypothetical protein
MSSTKSPVVKRPGLKLTTHLYIMSSLSTRWFIIPFFHVPSWRANGRLYLHICLYQRDTIPKSEALLLTVFCCLPKITLWKKDISQNEVCNFFIYLFCIYLIILSTVYQCSAHARHALQSLVMLPTIPLAVPAVLIKVQKSGEVSYSRKRVWLKWARWNYCSPNGSWAKWM